MNKILALAAALILSSCGFHLKGHYAVDHLPAQNWHIEGRELQQPLETAIRHASGNPVSARNAQASLRVVSVETKRDIYTITRGAKLNEYLLSMRVNAQAYYDGRAWGKPIVVEVRQVLPYADGMVLGKQEEEQTIWREMQNDAAQQIVRQLGFIGQ